MSRPTTITIQPDTRQRLKAAKRGGETYDEQLVRLLRVVETWDYLPPAEQAQLTERVRALKALEVLGP